MIYTIRESKKKKATNKIIYTELEEKEFSKIPTISEKIKIGRKLYKIKSITLNEKTGEKFLDVIETDKNYQDDIKKMPVRDRLGHQVIAKGDIEETIDSKGKVIRRWKDGVLLYGKPYPEIKKDSI